MGVTELHTLLLVSDTLDEETSSIFGVEIPAVASNFWKGVDGGSEGDEPR